MELSAVQHKFILHWGEMGTKWGINRTVAQIHALLYVSGRSMHAEEIAETLSVARSNVSTSLRELQSWGIIKVVQQLGDRRDYYEAIADVWQIYAIIMDERKRREIDPTIEFLRTCVADSDKYKPHDSQTHDRLAELLGFVETMSAWYEQVRRLPPGAFKRMAKLGGKIADLLGPGKKNA
ncbi:MAG: MarR family transcriptional regulator [Planctomycetes bacterium]|nr:MarR family transcriptional regulator [Planctomycetota bacterium]